MKGGDGPTPTPSERQDGTVGLCPRPKFTYPDPHRTPLGQNRKGTLYSGPVRVSSFPYVGVGRGELECRDTVAPWRRGQYG